MKELLPLFVRLAIYSVFMFLIIQIVALDFREADFTESSFTEIAQKILLTTMVLGLVFFSYNYPRFRIISIIMALFFLVHFFRELDSFFDENFFDGFWQLIVWLTVAVAGFITIKNFKKLVSQLTVVHHQFSFGVLLVGLVILHVFSRLYGKTSNWQNLLDDAYVRTVKDASEESIELLGYTIITIAVFELMIFMRTRLK